MKIFILPLLFLFTYCSQRKAVPSLTNKTSLVTDSLKKYTYSLLGFKVSGNYTYQAFGSGFFYRHSGGLYLITAKHVLSGCLDTAKIKNHPDVINILIENDSGL